MLSDGGSMSDQLEALKTLSVLLCLKINGLEVSTGKGINDTDRYLIDMSVSTNIE